MTNKARPQTSNSFWLVHAALLSVQLSFGGFHVFAKYLLRYMHPLALAGIRILIAMPILLVTAYAVERTLPKLRDLPHLALLGFLGVFANQVLFILGLNYTTATNAAIFMPSIPVFAAGVAVLLRVEKMSVGRMIGILLAVGGAVAMLDFSNVTFGRGPFFGNILMLFNCLSYAAFLVLQRPILKRLPPLTVIAWAFVFGFIFILPVSAGKLITIDTSVLPDLGWVGLVYVILLPTVYSYAANTWAIRRSTPTLAATYTTLQPVATATLAAFFLGEMAGWRQAVGFVLIMGGLAVVSRAMKKTSAANAKIAASEKQ